MKKTIKLKAIHRIAGIIAIVAVIGLSVMGCPSDTGSDSTSDNNNEGNTNNPTSQPSSVTYTVTYSIGGSATGTPPEARTVTAGTTINLHNGSGFYRDGYILTGWYILTNIGGTEPDYDLGASYTVNKNITFYARWALARTVSFDIRGGSGTTPVSFTVVNGSTITLPGSTNFSNRDFQFGGWATNVSGTGTVYSAGSTFTVTENVTLYAQWRLSDSWTSTTTVNAPNPYVLTAVITLNVDGTYTYRESYLGLAQNYSGTYYIEGSAIRTSSIGNFQYIDSNTLTGVRGTYIR